MIHYPTPTPPVRFFSDPDQSFRLKMFLKGETLPTPCLIILSKEREVKRKDVDVSGHLLCLSAQLLRLLLLLTAL